MMTPGRHPTWPWAVSCELDALFGLGRVAEAHARARAYLVEAERAGLQIMSHHVRVPLALAEARLGRYEDAVARIEACIAHREQLGCRGLNLGWAYEQRAPVAIWMRDQLSPSPRDWADALGAFLAPTTAGLTAPQ